MSWLEVLAVIGIIGFVIYQQLAGQPLQGRRLVVLPPVVTVIGFSGLRGHHLGPADLAWLTAGAAGSLLFTLGLNRLGQAAVIVPRAMRGRDRDASGRY